MSEYFLLLQNHATSIYDNVGKLASLVKRIRQQGRVMVSIDLFSWIHFDWYDDHLPRLNTIE